MGKVETSEVVKYE